MKNENGIYIYLIRKKNVKIKKRNIIMEINVKESLDFIYFLVAYLV